MYRKCAFRECTDLTTEEYCLYHAGMIGTCKHRYYVEMSVPVPFCDVDDKRLLDRCNNCNERDEWR